MRRVIVLSKWERLTVIILGNEDASTEGEAEGRKRIEGPKRTDRTVKKSICGEMIFIRHSILEFRNSLVKYHQNNRM